MAIENNDYSEYLDEMARVEKLKELQHLTGIEARRARYNLRRGPKSGQLVTKCPEGHEYTPENTIVNSAGRRTCRQCLNAKRVYTTPAIKPAVYPSAPLGFNEYGYQTRNINSAQVTVKTSTPNTVTGNQ